MNDELQSLEAQALRHRKEMQSALRDLRGSARIAVGAVRYLQRSSRLLSAAAVAGVAGLAILQWRRGGIPRGLITAGIIIDAARIWRLRQPVPPPPPPRLLAPPKRSEV